MNVSIEKIEIVAFGKLKNAVVTPQKGINILSAPNESGKTTLAAFIKFVFYGYAGARLQTLTENERKLYSPWSTEVSEGSITVNADGTRYTVHRLCPPSGKETVEVINRTTGKPEFNGAVPGEVFFGVGEDIFARTLFFRQLALPQNKDEVLAERLRNIAISADEQVGTKKAVGKLKDAKNELIGKAGKGIVPALERERDSIEESLTSSADMRREITKLREEIGTRAERIGSNDIKLNELRSERENIEKYDALLKLRNINRLAAQEQLAREEFETASSALKKCGDNGELLRLTAANTELFAEKRNAERLKSSLSEAESEFAGIQKRIAENNSEKAQAAKKSMARNSKIFKTLVACACILSVASCAVFFAGFRVIGCAAICVSAVVACVSLVFLSGKNPRKYGFESREAVEASISALPALEAQLANCRARAETVKSALEQSEKKTEKLSNDIRRAVSDYITAESGSDVTENIEKIRALSAEIARRQAVFEARRSELDNALSGLNAEELTERARGATEPERERAVVDRELNFYTQQNSQLQELNRRAEIDCASLEAKSGDPATLVGKRDALDGQIRELTLKHKAYETAVRLIEDAGDHMKGMVAPRIGARADEYFTAATGGKYRGLEIDTRLSMTVGEDLRRSCDYLSAGTRDSAYLSLRLALADMLFGGCGVPMILDDAFVRIDDERLEMMANALKEAAVKHQIFIFTHGEREKLAFTASGVDFSEISIEV